MTLTATDVKHIRGRGEGEGLELIATRHNSDSSAAYEMIGMSEEVDTTVKLALYRTIAATGAVPTSTEVAQATGMAENDVRGAFARLHAKRLLVPEPGDPSRIRMAPPFSGVPTAFPVEAQGKRYYANCVWDAYGIAAALHADAVIPACDGYSDEPLTLEVREDQPITQPYVAHFAVPAAHWWDDIIHT